MANGADNDWTAPKDNYRKPPVEHQFKKGRSGNPGGRPPKKVRAYTQRQATRDILELAELLITIRTSSGPKEVSIIQAIRMRIVQRAMADHEPSQRYFNKLYEDALERHRAANPEFMENLEWLEQTYLDIEDPHPAVERKNVEFLNERRKKSRRI